MPGWSADDISDLTGKVAIVTGATRGLGLASAAALAAHGARVVLAGRNEERCTKAIALIKDAIPSALIETEQLNLSDLASVQSFAEKFSAGHERLDILLNNAGIMAPPQRMTTAQGFELQFGVNHLGHFALTGRLMPLILATPAARVVTVSSLAHRSGEIDFDNLQADRNYQPYSSYADSKLANLLFMLKLDAAFRDADTDAISVGAHPGLVSTNLQAAGPFLGKPAWTSWVVLAGVRVLGQSPSRGALPELYAATAPDVEGGDFFGPSGGMRGHVVPAGMSIKAHDEDDANSLWQVSAQLTGVDMDAAIAGSRA
ncbi:MAG: SDR family oxidoreductase [Coriobacteriia bacterium]|nr:SDR family oxidoreductase [Coriobacteriia bacterium]